MGRWSGVSIEAVAELLGLEGQREGSCLRCADPFEGNGRGRSLAIDLYGDQWFSHRHNRGGGPGHLVEFVLGCDWRAAADWGEQRGLLTKRGRARHSLGVSRPARSSASRRDGSSPTHRGPGPTDAIARELATACSPADSTPASEYLVRRRAWPPERALPSAIHWVLAEQARQVRFPAGAAGALLFVYSRADHNSKIGKAVSVEGLDTAGHRLDEIGFERWRRTFGSRKGAFFAPVPRPNAERIVVCEGEIDALALALLCTDAEVRGTGGTAGMTMSVATDVLRRPVVVYSDPGGPGRAAAARIQGGLRRAGRECSVRYADDGTGDPAEILATEVEKRAAACGSLKEGWHRVLHDVSLGRLVT